jgi:hypothetical protein
MKYQQLREFVQNSDKKPRMAILMGTMTNNRISVDSPHYNFRQTHIALKLIYPSISPLWLVLKKNKFRQSWSGCVHCEVYHRRSLLVPEGYFPKIYPWWFKPRGRY